MESLQFSAENPFVGALAFVSKLMVETSCLCMSVTPQHPRKAPCR